jgi:hypothetical protein
MSAASRSSVMSFRDRGAVMGEPRGAAAVIAALALAAAAAAIALRA